MAIKIGYNYLMLIKRLLLVLGIILVFGISFYHMNLNFDVLSRYPYENEYYRSLIRKYLNTQEIEYIIENSIAPTYFASYIEYPSFNIYHVELYNEMSEVAWYMNEYEIVEFTEEVFKIDKFAEAKDLIRYYSKDEVLYWLKNGDLYNPNSVLIENPELLDINLDNSHTISTRVPNDLVTDEINGHSVTLKKEALEALKKLYNDLTSEIDEAKSLVFTRSYVSYDEQVVLYRNRINYPCDFDYPGHSEHQLGLTVDIYLEDLDDSLIHDWLINNSKNYGFYFPYSDREFHLRFRGI